MTLDVFNPIFCGKQSDIPQNLQYRTPYQRKHLERYMKIIGITTTSGWSKKEMCDHLSRPHIRNKLNKYTKKGKYTTPIITPNSNMNYNSNNNGTYVFKSPNPSNKRPSRSLTFLAKKYKVPLTTKIHRQSKFTRRKTTGELKRNITKSKQVNN